MHVGYGTSQSPHTEVFLPSMEYLKTCAGWEDHIRIRVSYLLGRASSSGFQLQRSFMYFSEWLQGMYKILEAQNGIQKFCFHVTALFPKWH